MRFMPCVLAADMKELENEVRAVKKDGLLWGTCKSYLVCLAPQQNCTVAAHDHK